jgi:hypothetical protein
LVDDEVFDGGRAKAQVRLGRQLGLHRLAVERAINLGARTPDGGALRPVQKAELNAGLVSHAPHEAVQGVDLAHQVALAKAADCGVARHFADAVQAVRHEKGGRADAGRRGCGFTAGVAASDNNDVEGRDGGS